MNNKVMFVVGCFIFLTYVYFLFTIIKKQKNKRVKRNENSFDTSDQDGIGNQGRFPVKE